MSTSLRNWVSGLAGAVLLSVTAQALADGEPCYADRDCPGTSCGDAVCNWTRVNPNPVGSKLFTCNPAGSDVQGLDGWCTTNDDCKCQALGAACVNAHCSFTLADSASGAGAGGAGGADPGAGGAGGSVPSPTTRLGRACHFDADCQDSQMPGLQCVTETQLTLGVGAPPRGLCTATCAIDDDCAAFGAGSLCFPFNGAGGPSYCIEGCSFGVPDLGQAKCHNRPEMACEPALLAPTSAACVTLEDCADGEVCSAGTCDVVLPGCLPACRGDIDCAEGMYCDQSFLSGVCLPQKPVGKRLGEPCAVVAGEPDECLGFCQADTTNSAQGHCSTTCALGQACAWDPASKRYDGACFYGSVLTANGTTGDFGFCTPTCSCSRECPGADLSCQVLGGGAGLDDTFHGPGLCFTNEPGVQLLEQCESQPGSAGAGGASDGASGSTSGPGGGASDNTGGNTPATGGRIGSETGTAAAPPNSDNAGQNAGGSNASHGGESTSCGCRLAASERSGAGAAWLLGLLLMRRRRSRRTQQASSREPKA